MTGMAGGRPIRKRRIVYSQPISPERQSLCDAACGQAAADDRNAFAGLSGNRTAQPLTQASACHVALVAEAWRLVHQKTGVPQVTANLAGAAPSRRRGTRSGQSPQLPEQSGRPPFGEIGI